MMRCRDVRKKLDLFVTGELGSPLYERIEAHLTTCARCQEQLACLHRLDAVLGTVPAPPIPDGFAERVVGLARRQHSVSARRESPRSPAWHRIRFAGATAAALAAGLLLGLIMGRDTWRSDPGLPTLGQRQTADLFAVAGLEQLVEPGGDSLAQAYLQLTAANDR